MNKNPEKYAKITLAIILIVTIAAIFIVRNIKFNYVVEDYFPKNDKNSAYFLSFLQDFENDVDFVLVALTNDNGIFDSTFLQKANRLTKDLKKNKYVVSVQSPTTIKEFLLTPGGVFQVPILHYDNPQKYTNDSLRIYNSGAFVGSFFSEDAKHLTINLNNAPNLNREQSDSLMQFVDSTVAAYQFDNTTLMGRIIAQDYYKNQMGFEIVLFTGISAVLLVIFMFLIYRNYWSIGIAAMVISFSVLWTIAFVLLIEEELNIMMTLLPVLLFVIGISDIVHLLTKYIEELRAGKEKIEAIKNTFKEVGLATLLTSLTTAIGFISLAMSDAPPIKYFGIYTSIGVVITFIIAITLLLSVLVLIKKPELAQNTNQQKLLWNKLLQSLMLFTISKRKTIALGTVFILIISAMGISNIKVNNLFLEDLDDKSSLKQDIYYFENNFNGIRPLEVGIKLKDTTKSILDGDVLREIDKVERFLISNYDAGFAVSPTQILKTINQSQNGGLPENFKLPDDDKKLKKLVDFIQKNKLFTNRLKVVAKDQKSARISTKMKDIGSIEQNKLNTKFHAYLAENVNLNILDFQLTGVAYLLDKTNESISRTLLEGLVLAALVIAIIMGFVLKSVKMIIISFIPNLVPLVIIGGVIGFAGYDLKISTAIIFTIAFGICVDDTIHFLSKFKIELNKGKSMLYALKRTYLSTGKAIILTSVILSTGFVTFMLSDFSSTVQIGLLISITLVFAVLSDLLLLPVLLIWFYKAKV